MTMASLYSFLLCRYASDFFPQWDFCLYWYVGIQVIFFSLFNSVGMRARFLHFSFLFKTLLQFAIVEHYFVDGAIHVCQTGGACDAVKE